MIKYSHRERGNIKHGIYWVYCGVLLDWIIAEFTEDAKFVHYDRLDDRPMDVFSPRFYKKITNPPKLK